MFRHVPFVRIHMLKRKHTEETVLGEEDMDQFYTQPLSQTSEMSDMKFDACSQDICQPIIPDLGDDLGTMMQKIADLSQRLVLTYHSQKPSPISVQDELDKVATRLVYDALLEAQSMLYKVYYLIKQEMSLIAASFKVVSQEKMILETQKEHSQLEVQGILSRLNQELESNQMLVDQMQKEMESVMLQKENEIRGYKETIAGWSSEATRLQEAQVKYQGMEGVLNEKDAAMNALVQVLADKDNSIIQLQVREQEMMDNHQKQMAVLEAKLAELEAQLEKGAGLQVADFNNRLETERNNLKIQFDHQLQLEKTVLKMEFDNQLQVEKAYLKTETDACLESEKEAVKAQLLLSFDSEKLSLNSEYEKKLESEKETIKSQYEEQLASEKQTIKSQHERLESEKQTIKSEYESRLIEKEEQLQRLMTLQENCIDASSLDQLKADYEIKLSEKEVELLKLKEASCSESSLEEIKALLVEKEAALESIKLEIEDRNQSSRSLKEAHDRLEYKCKSQTELIDGLQESLQAVSGQLLQAQMKLLDAAPSVGDQQHQLSVDFDALKEKYEQLMTEFTSQKSHYEQLMTKFTSQKSHYEQCMSDLEAKSKALDDLTTRNQQLDDWEQSCKVLIQERSDWEMKLTDLKSQIDILEFSKSQLEKSIMERDQALFELNQERDSEFADLRERQKSDQMLHHTLEQEVARLQDTIQNLNAEKETLTASLNEMQQTQEASHEQIRTLESQIASMNSVEQNEIIEKLQAEREQLLVQLNQQQVLLDNIEQTRETAEHDWESQSNTLKEQIKNQTELIESQTAMLAQLNQDKASLETRLGELQENSNNLREMMRKVETKLQQESEALKTAQQETAASLEQIETMSKQLADIRETHQGELTSQLALLKESHEAELNNQLNQLKETHEAELNNQLDQLKETHEIDLNNQLNQLKETHEIDLNNQLNQLKKTYEIELNTQLNQLKETHANTIHHLESTHHELSQTLEKLEIENKTLKDELCQHLTTTNDQMNKIKQLETMNHQLCSEKETMSSEIQIQLAKIDQMIQEMNTIQSNNTRLEGENEHLSQQIQTLAQRSEEKDEAATTMNRKLQAEYENLEHEKTLLEQQITDLQRQTKAMGLLKQQIADLQQQTEAMDLVKQQLTVLQKETEGMDQVKQEIASLKTQCETTHQLEKEVALYKEQLSALNLGKILIENDLKAQVDLLRNQVDANALTLNEAQSKLKKADIDYKELVRQNAEFVKGHEASKSTRNRLESEIASLKSQILKLSGVSPGPSPAVVEKRPARTRRAESSSSVKLVSNLESIEESPKSTGLTFNLENVKRQQSAPTSTPVSKRTRTVAPLRALPLNETTPGTVRRTRLEKASVLISFSGFKEGTPFDAKLKKSLILAIKGLPDAAIISGTSDSQAFDKRITHLIQPPSSRTLKSFAASLSNSWLITDPQWVFESAKKGRWIDEQPFGLKPTSNPFYKKKVHLTASFKDCPKTRNFRVNFMKTLVIDCSDGSFVETPEGADFILRGDNDITYSLLT